MKGAGTSDMCADKDKKEQGYVQEKRRDAWMRRLFFVYVLLLVFVVIIKFDGSMENLSIRINTTAQNREAGYWNLNLVPGATIGLYMRYIRNRFAWMNLLANVVAFIPWGFFLPRLYVRWRKWYKILGISFVFIFSMELFQLVTLLGSFDVDDIILNLLGCFVGYRCFRHIYS